MSGNFNYCPTHGLNHCHGHHHRHYPHPHIHVHQPTWVIVTKWGIVGAALVCTVTGFAPGAAIAAGIASALGGGKQ
ncbi:hypothetical protein [Planktothrix mougeotii]|uniref:Uncharacterized protein n=1 Tax=Planktothrix mougeotii LEGE 06226 TaxID=1828728 RepID=A0ABR9U7L6_9CYAN|nr:hypothetical protein [Planktothrix mougeotii]MBE9142427.1 hypothetical protein [Planktothrix mougeotii LEGE 06226]